jgi:hypothetical protein
VRPRARIPGTNTFPPPTRRSPGLTETSDLLVIDTEGKLIAGEGEPNSRAREYFAAVAFEQPLGSDQK